MSISREKNSHRSNFHNIHDINSVLIIPHLHDVNGDEKDGRVDHPVEEAEECPWQNHLILRHIGRVMQNTRAFSFQHFADFRLQTIFFNYSKLIINPIFFFNFLLFRFALENTRSNLQNF